MQRRSKSLRIQQRPRDETTIYLGEVEAVSRENRDSDVGWSDFEVAGVVAAGMLEKVLINTSTSQI